MQQQPNALNFFFGGPGVYDVNFKLNVGMQGQTAYQGATHQQQQHQPEYQKQVQFQNQGYGSVSLPPTHGRRCRKHNTILCYFPVCQEEEAASSGFWGGVPSSNSCISAAGPQHQFEGNAPYPNRGAAADVFESSVSYNKFTSGIKDTSAMCSSFSTPQSEDNNKRCDIF